MLKKLSVLAVVLLILAQASAVFAGNIPVNKFTPVLDGVISENEYPAGSAYVLDKKTVDAYAGCWAGEMNDGQQVTYYLAWDDTGLYCAADIKDSTPVPAQSWDAHGGDGGPAADGFQLNLFGGDGGIARWLTIGAYADGKLAARTHYGDVSDLADYVKGTAVYNDNGVVIECMIPWDIIDGGETIAEGLSIPVLFTYMDRSADGEVCYKTLDAAAWPPSADIDNFLVLGAAYTAPAAETEAPAETAADAPATDTPAAQTSDAAIVIGAVVLAAAAAVVLSKKAR